MRAGAEGQVTNVTGGSSSTRYASRDGLILFIAVPNQRLDEYNTNLLDCVTLRKSNSHSSNHSRPAHRPHADRKTDSSTLAGSQPDM